LFTDLFYHQLITFFMSQAFFVFCNQFPYQLIYDRTFRNKPFKFGTVIYLHSDRLLIEFIFQVF